MLTAGDDYPIHQTPEPVALVTDRNFYDRFFWNGYSQDGSLFFAAAMGVYPALDVIDGAFCVCVDGVQHNARFSARLNGERMAMAVGPLRVEILAPLHEVRIRLAPNDGPMTAELTFTGRHFPIEEPRFTRRVGTRLFMDYTRMTQNGRWSGWIDVGGNRHMIDAATLGTRDRSWGIRPVGKADAQPAPMPPQFWWLWTPTQFDHASLFLHSNDDGEGRPWNRRVVLFAEGGPRGGDEDVEAPALLPAYVPGTRRIASVSADLGEQGRLTLTPVSGMGARGHFYMSGLGYTHPEWGHGHDHGTYEEGHDSIDLRAAADNDPALMHIQALAEAVLEVGGERHVGRGVIEQLFIGQHAASGLTGLFDPFCRLNAMPDFPTRPDAMEVGWLAAALGAPEGSLAGFTASPVGTGQMCDSFRLTLDWAVRPDGAPASIIAKCPSLDPASRNIAERLGNYVLEVSWYRELADTITVPRPACHFADIAADGVDFLLLLEDLSPARQGDQLAGAGADALMLGVDAAARLHAPYWNSPRIDELAWLQRDSRELVRQLFPVLYAGFRERYAGRLDADCLALGAEIVARLDRWLDRTPPVRTIIHGDLRLDNILFAPDLSACWVLDWQTLGIGSGASDIAYLIGTGVADAGTRRSIDRPAFERWLAGLSVGGVSPDEEALWREYRLGALSGYFMAVFASMSVERTERGDEMFAVMAERPARQAIDLDSLALL